MSEWENYKVENLVNYKKGYAFKSSFYDQKGDHFIVRVSDTTENSINIKTCHKIRKENVQGLDAYIIRHNDVVIATVGSWADNPQSIVGKVIKVPRDANGAYLNQNAVRLRSNGKVTQDYLYFVLKNKEFSDYLLNSAQGSANQASITLKDIFSYRVTLPPVPEQKAIASVLSSLDDKIDLLHRQNKTLEAMAETLFRQWFIEEAKEDWEEVKVKDYVTLNKSTLNKNYPFTEILYLDTGSLTKGVISELQPYNLKEAPSRAKRLVQNDDVLISTVRPNQCHYGIVSRPKDNLVVSTGFCTVTCNQISPYFIYLLLTSDDMTEYLHSVAEGSTSTYPSLKPEDIGAVTFKLPPEDLMYEFHSIAESYWKKIHMNLEQIQTLEQLRDTLLPKLMSGEVRVQYQSEQVA